MIKELYRLEEAKEWTKMASYHIGSVTILLNNLERTHPSILTYHCHQSVEKMLKAHLIFEGQNISKTSNLDELLSSIQAPLKYSIDDLIYLNKLQAISRHSISLEITKRSYEISKKFYDQNNIS